MGRNAIWRGKELAKNIQIGLAEQLNGIIGFGAAQYG
jgi:hypothetical protein